MCLILLRVPMYYYLYIHTSQQWPGFRHNFVTILGKNNPSPSYFPVHTAFLCLTEWKSNEFIFGRTRKSLKQKQNDLQYIILQKNTNYKAGKPIKYYIWLYLIFVNLYCVSERIHPSGDLLRCSKNELFKEIRLSLLRNYWKAIYFQPKMNRRNRTIWQVW